MNCRKIVGPRMEPFNTIFKKCFHFIRSSLVSVLHDLRFSHDRHHSLLNWFYCFVNLFIWYLKFWNIQYVSFTKQTIWSENSEENVHLSSQPPNSTVTIVSVPRRFPERLICGTDLGEGNFIFCCTGTTDSNFWQIKIIRLTSHIFLLLLFFLRWFKI